MASFHSAKNMPAPTAIIRGEGSLLIDENNNSYIDAISSWWVTLHGMPILISPKNLRAGIEDRAGNFAGFTHQPAVDLAEKLLQLLPAGFSKVFTAIMGLPQQRSH